MRSWDYLTVLSNSENFKILKRNLLVPSLVEWPSEEEELDKAYEEIAKNLPKDLCPLLNLSLFSSLLLQNSLDKNISAWIRKKLKPDELLPGFDSGWLDCASGAMNMPVAVYQGGRGLIINFIIVKRPALTSGLFKPDWLNAHLDDSATQAVQAAFELAIRHSSRSAGVYLYPLLDTGKNSDKIIGPSLFLPLYLGFRATICDLKLFDSLVATGKLKKKDSIPVVGGVGGIAQKAKAVWESSYRLFLYPSENKTEMSQLKLDSLFTRDVSSLEKAWFLARYYSPGKEDELTIFEAALNDPEGFIANAANLPVDFLACAVNEAKQRGFFDQIAEDHNLAASFIAMLDRCYYQKRAYNMLEKLGLPFKKDSALECLGKTSPSNAFQLCSLMFKLATHSGEIAQADLWKEKAFCFLNEARQVKSAAVTSFLNSCLVDEMHNRYDFRKELPDSFSKEVKKREKIHAISPEEANDHLGRLYGTIAQHYGFCKDLDSCVEYATKAMNAFGAGKVKELRNDWQRQFSCIFYASLDAKKYDKARNALLSYLSISSFEDCKIEELDPFQLAALLRFLADTCQPGTPVFFKKAKEKLLKKIETHAKAGHPWQLSLYNLGRLLFINGDQDEAIKAWQKSLELCRKIGAGRSRGDTTVKLMALLPLSQLYKAGEEVKHEDISDILKSASSLVSNNPNFDDLIQKEPFPALDAVYEDPARFFPFSYR